MKSKNIVPVVIILAALGIGAWYYTTYKTAPSLPAYTTTVLDSNSHAVNLSELKGSYVLISYFQTWCGDCVRELPGIQNLQDIAGKNKLKVLMVSDEEKSKIERFRSKFNVKLDFYNSPEPLKNSIKVYPTTYLLDKEGKVILSKLEGYQWDSKEVLQLIQ